MNDLETLRDLLGLAVRARRLLHIHYRCYSRVVEPWALAVDQQANDVLIAWQISGGSASNVPTGWKQIRIRELGGVTVLPESFEPKPDRQPPLSAHSPAGLALATGPLPARTTMMDDGYPAWSERGPRMPAMGDAAWKVLIADDDDDVHKVTRLALADFVLDGRPLRFLDAYSGRAAVDAMIEHPDMAMVLMDVVMESESDGLEAVDAIRNRLGNANVRVVLRTGNPGSAPEREVLARYDIDDYREKTQLTGTRLFTTVYTALRTHDRLCQTGRREEFARHQASHDALTQLPNRLLFLDRLHKTLERCGRRQTSSALLYLDVDDFKPVNDRFGHEAGDALLIAVSRRIRRAVRAVDTVARLAGDEFAVIMDEPLSRTDVLPVVARIAEEMQRPHQVQVGGGPETVNLQVGVSIGVAVFPEHAETVGQLVRVADDAMYSAKKSGNGGWALAPDRV